MVPSETEETAAAAATTNEAAEAGDTAAVLAAAARQAPPRIQTRIVIGATLDGIGFAPLASDPETYVSAPIRDPAVLMRLCSIEGFQRARDISDADLAAVDAAITLYADTEKDKAQSATSGYEVAALKRTVDELTRANLAMSGDLATAIAERDEGRRLLSGSEAIRMQQQIESLKQQMDQGGGASVALEAENERLRAVNASLTAELAALKGAQAA